MDNIVIFRISRGEYHTYYFRLIKEDNGEYWAQMAIDNLNFGYIPEGYCGMKELDAIDYFLDRWIG